MFAPTKFFKEKGMIWLLKLTYLYLLQYREAS